MKSKWAPQNAVIDINNIPADALTNCLKTVKNTLSVWYISDISELDNAIVAIVGGFDSLDTIDVILIDDTEITKNSIKITSTLGSTVSSLQNTHRDLDSLNFNHMVSIKDIIVDTFLNRSARIKRYTERQLIHLLVSAEQRGVFDRLELKERLRNKVFPSN